MGNNINKLDQEMVKSHNTSYKSRLKIFLFGTNAGKSRWFNETWDPQPLVGITFKTCAYSIGDKLPDIETIIYDTAQNMGFVDEHLHYVSAADGIVLTYNTHNIESLSHLGQSIDKIIQQTFFSTKHTRCLLLGIKEVKEENNPLHFEHSNCIEAAQQFAAKWNLFHKQIDITKDIKTREPYIYLLRRILKQKDDDDDDDDDSKDEHKGSENSNDEYDDDDDEEDTVLLVHDIMGDFLDAEVDLFNQPGSPHISPHTSPIIENLFKEQKSLDHNDIIDYDAECQSEFKRFLQVSLGKSRCDKYLPRFIATQSNDIRFVDPDILDNEFLSNDDIDMIVLDRKLFVLEIDKFKQDTLKFEKKLASIHMKEKYHKHFVNRGLATLWSFYFHIKSPKYIDKIIKNKNDSMIIWKKLGRDNIHKKVKNKKKKRKKKNAKMKLLNSQTKGGDDVVQQVQQVEGDTSDEDASDSDEMYNNEDGQQTQALDGLNVTTLLNSDGNSHMAFV